MLRPSTTPSKGMSARLQQKQANSPLLEVPKSGIRGVTTTTDSISSSVPYQSRDSGWLPSESVSECDDDEFGDVSYAQVPGFAIEDDGNLHPAVRAAKEDTFCTSLLGCDLTRNRKLLDHFKKYHLTDFFDDRGQRRYQNLSMSFAAKLNPETQCAFGSSGTKKNGTDLNANFSSVHLSARAFRLATASVQKDRETAKQRIQDEYGKLDDVEKVQCKDIKRRQLEMLFQEVPSHEQYLPPGVTEIDLLPLDVSRLQERDEKKRFERLNALVSDVATKTEWPGEGAQVKGMTHPLTTALHQLMFRKEDVFEILCSIATWTTAAGSSHMGVDRAVFCRYITGLGLVDQSKLPYVWALSVFDQFAKPVRVSGFSDCEWNSNSDNSVSDRVAFAPLLSKWDFVNVMDVLMRCRYSKSDLYSLMASIREATSHLTHESQMKDGDRKTSNSDKRESRSSQKSTNILLDSSTAAPVFPRDDEQKGVLREAMVVNRHRLITGMLSEPEVLQLIEQFKLFFQDVFNIYADVSEADVEGDLNAKPGEVKGMDFVSFLQFCQDFRIVPCLVTTHEVSRAYHSAECAHVSVRTQKVDERNEKLRADEKHRKVNTVLQEFADLCLATYQDLNAAFIAFDTNKNGEINITKLRLGSSRIGFNGNFKTVFSELADNGEIRRDQFLKLYEHVSMSGRPSLDSERSGKSRLGRLEAVRCSTAPGRSSNISPIEFVGSKKKTPKKLAAMVPAPGSAWGEGKKFTSPTKETTALLDPNLRDARTFGEKSQRKTGTQSARDDPKNRFLPTLESVLTENLAASPSPEYEDVHVSTFGLAAFVESICRICLSYLLVHGNAAQLAASSRAKMVWLLVYLQSAIEHWRNSVERHLHDKKNTENGESGEPRRISRPLASVLAQISLDSLKDLKAMPLQLDRYSLQRTRPDTLSVAESPTPRDRRSSYRRRRKSASDLPSNESGTSGRRPSIVRRSSTGTCSDSMTGSMGSPRSADGSRSDVFVPFPGRNALDSLDGASQGSKATPTQTPRSGATPTQTPRAGNKQVQSADSESVKELKDFHHQQQRRAQDIVQSAISNRPPPPPLRDDSFKFEDLLFTRLLRKVSPPKQRMDRSQTPTLAPVGNHSSELPQSRAQKHIYPMESLRMHSKATPTDSVRPVSTLLLQERGNLLKGLENCIGKLDRCELTPPPMSAYAAQLNERLESMIGLSSNPPKPHTAPCGSLQRQMNL